MTNEVSNDLISREDVVTIIEAMIFESGKKSGKSVSSAGRKRKNWTYQASI